MADRPEKKDQSIRRRILLVEDEPHLAFNLRLNLEAEGFDVSLAKDGKVALDLFKNSETFDLIILDVNLPFYNGFEVARRVRMEDARTGILMLTARASERDRLEGFQAGTDDYITKPFHLEEFLARVRRMIQRATFFGNDGERAVLKATKIFRYNEFELDAEGLRLRGPTGEFQLTSLEADVLREFFTKPGEVLSREFLLENVWGMKGNIETRTVDNFIVRLRRYLEKTPTEPQFLTSVRGRGYRLETNDSASTHAP
jgi:two-component system alkaline phosphatase synthesis response regulator PhoP